MAPVLLALRFGLEMALLGTLGWLGFRTVDNAFGGLLVAATAVLLTATIWGLLLSPRRRFDLPLGSRVAIELVLFGAAAAGLATAGRPVWGVGLFVLELLVLAGLASLGYPPGSNVGDSAPSRPS
jgi:hypothetical protein